MFDYKHGKILKKTKLQHKHEHKYAQSSTLETKVDPRYDPQLSLKMGGKKVKYSVFLWYERGFWTKNSIRRYW